MAVRLIFSEGGFDWLVLHVLLFGLVLTPHLSAGQRESMREINMAGPSRSKKTLTYNWQVAGLSNAVVPQKAKLFPSRGIVIVTTVGSVLNDVGLTPSVMLINTTARTMAIKAATKQSPCYLTTIGATLPEIRDDLNAWNNSRVTLVQQVSLDGTSIPLDNQQKAMVFQSNGAVARFCKSYEVVRTRIIRGNSRRWNSQPTKTLKMLGYNLQISLLVPDPPTSTKQTRKTTNSANNNNNNNNNNNKSNSNNNKKTRNVNISSRSTQNVNNNMPGSRRRVEINNNNNNLSRKKYVRHNFYGQPSPSGTFRIPISAISGRRIIPSQNFPPSSSFPSSSFPPSSISSASGRPIRGDNANPIGVGARSPDVTVELHHGNSNGDVGGERGSSGDGGSGGVGTRTVTQLRVPPGRRVVWIRRGPRGGIKSKVRVVGGRGRRQRRMMFVP